ncbi:MAG TPA: formyltransferase family protein [Solirubrobacteraceae bacterium]
MRIVFLTTGDPLYLPAFFARVLERRAADTLAVYVVPPLYKGQSTAAAAARYARTFGPRATVELARRTLGARLRGRSIEAVCARHGVRCEPVADVNAPAFVARLRAERPDVAVSVSCPQLFGPELIAVPPHGILNLHGAILPHYRGVMPSFWMLANGEREAGVSVGFVDEVIDAGDLAGQRRFAIDPAESLDRFLRRSKAIAADLVLEVLDALERGAATRTPIDVAAGSYYSWPGRADVARFRARGRRLW